MITLQQLELIWDYLYWLYEYSLLLLIWRKLKKKTITIPQDKYNIVKTRRLVNLSFLRIRVPIYDIQGVYLIYPYKLEFNKPLKLLFFNYSSLNNL